MKRLIGLSALALALAASACAPEQDPLDILEVGELDDRLLDYPFVPQVSEIVEVGDIEVSASSRVRLASSKDHLVVAGPLHVLDVPDEGMMFIHLEARSEEPAQPAPDADGEEAVEPSAEEGAPDTDADAPEAEPELPEAVEPEALEADDMRFVLFTENEEGAWTPIVILGEYDIDGIPTISQLISFDVVVYSPEHQRMVGYHGSIGREFSGAMDVPTTARIGVFALPEITAGELIGRHPYTLQALCGEGACQDPVPRGPRSDAAIGGSELGTSGALSR